MPDHDLDALARATRQRRRLPPDAACATCGETRHLSTRPDGRVLCYGCLRREGGASSTEEDHFAGRGNLPGLTVTLRATTTGL